MPVTSGSSADEEHLFLEALDLPIAERSAFLRNACADSALRARVEALLAAAEAPHFMPSPPTGGQPRLFAEGETAGQFIGPYKLLQSIGEGGFGTVWMAEQEQPVRRRVALKIIKAGMDTKEVIARFEQERQALAMMDHPNIAQVLDAGATASGRPYFVMELVQGTPITLFCDEHRLTPHQRLHLFIAVCHAVQHAHIKGIIHRDLKPSNILVTLHDGVPAPKVIDFGVAKAIQQRLTEKTLFTHFEQMVGTPLYMAPEQAEPSGLDVDTRCDVYALGILLYELLTGHTPFRQDELIKAGFDGMRRLICEREPKKPSTLLRTLSPESASSIATQRQTEPPKLVTLLSGDLDWIVMKAMEKDRRRRYETVSALAEDIRRHLGNEPVLARPPSRIYSLGKMVKRNKAAFITVSLVAVSVLVGLAVSTTLYFRLRSEKAQRAVEAAQFAIMSGEDKWISETIVECREAGVSPTFIGLLIAEQHLIQGRLREAITTLESLVQAAPESVAARALLATAYDLADDQQSFQRIMATLVNPRPSGREDLLMLGHALSHSSDQEERRQAVAYMEQALEGRDSPMARVLLAEARTRLALQSRSLDQIQSAITDINTAKGWLRSGIAVLSISAWAHAAAAHIASEKGRSDLVPAYLAVAEADGQRLHGYRPNPYAEKYRKLQLALFAEMDVPESPPKKVLPP